MSLAERHRLVHISEDNHGEKIYADGGLVSAAYDRGEHQGISGPNKPGRQEFWQEMPFGHLGHLDHTQWPVHSLPLSAPTFAKVGQVGRRVFLTVHELKPVWLDLLGGFRFYMKGENTEVIHTRA